MPSDKEKQTQHKKQPAGGRQSASSLVEALQNLLSDMTRAATETDVQEGLKRLTELRNNFLGDAAGELKSARRDAEALIAWVSQRLEQLRQQLANKRRIQEGEVMARLARQREAEGPSLLPTELIDAVVHATTPKDNGADKEAGPAVPMKPAKKPAPGKAPAKPAPKAAKPEAVKPEPTAVKPEQKPEPPAAVLKPQEPAKPEPGQAEQSPWTKYELLVAHMAASFQLDPQFFEKLRKAAKRNSPKLPAPADDGKAEIHFRNVHDLGKRLVNLELYTKALAKADQEQQPAAALLRTVARELRLFLRDLKACKQALPEMAGEYERLFGGYAQQFAAMHPEQGGALLSRCLPRQEAGHQQQAPEPRRETEPKAAEPEEPVRVLVLKRDDQ